MDLGGAAERHVLDTEMVYRYLSRRNRLPELENGLRDLDIFAVDQVLFSE